VGNASRSDVTLDPGSRGGERNRGQQPHPLIRANAGIQGPIAPRMHVLWVRAFVSGLWCDAM